MNEEQEREADFTLLLDTQNAESVNAEIQRWKITAAKYDERIGQEIESFNRILFQINDTQHLNFDELRLCVRAIGFAYADHATAEAGVRMLTAFFGDDSE